MAAEITQFIQSDKLKAENINLLIFNHPMYSNFTDCHDRVLQVDLQNVFQDHYFVDRNPDFTQCIDCRRRRLEQLAKNYAPFGAFEKFEAAKGTILFYNPYGNLQYIVPEGYLGKQCLTPQEGREAFKEQVDVLLRRKEKKEEYRYTDEFYTIEDSDFCEQEAYLFENPIPVKYPSSCEGCCKDMPLCTGFVSEKKDDGYHCKYKYTIDSIMLKYKRSIPGRILHIRRGHLINMDKESFYQYYTSKQLYQHNHPAKIRQQGFFPKFGNLLQRSDLSTTFDNKKNAIYTFEAICIIICIILFINGVIRWRRKKYFDNHVGHQQFQPLSRGDFADCGCGVSELQAVRIVSSSGIPVYGPNSPEATYREIQDVERLEESESDIPNADKLDNCVVKTIME